MNSSGTIAAVDKRNGRRRYVVVAVLLAALLGFPLLWFVRRYSYVAYIRQETAKGLYCEWGPDDKAISSADEVQWRAYLPGGGPIAIHVEYDVKDGQRLGKAIGNFGTLVSIKIAQGSPTEITGLLRGLGKQHSLRKVAVFGVPVGDEFTEQLAQFGSVTEMSIVPSKITGERFPLMPALSALDLANSPITDAGFYRLLQLPSLKLLSLKEPSISPLGLTKVLETTGRIEQIYISMSDIPAEKSQAIRSEYLRKWPHLILEVN
jgi:hypothetical protein